MSSSGLCGYHIYMQGKQSHVVAFYKALYSREKKGAPTIYTLLPQLSEANKSNLQYEHIQG